MLRVKRLSHKQQTCKGKRSLGRKIHPADYLHPPWPEAAEDFLRENYILFTDREMAVIISGIRKEPTTYLNVKSRRNAWGLDKR